MSSEKLTLAISAIKIGDKSTGERLLNDLLINEPENESAWIWLATCMDDLNKKIDCLQKAVAINPNNQIVIKALAKLQQSILPTLEEIVTVKETPQKTGHDQEIQYLNEQQQRDQYKSEVKIESAKQISGFDKSEFSNPETLKFRNQKNKRNALIIGISVVVILLVVIFLSGLIISSGFGGSKNKGNKAIIYNENDALLLVQNWKTSDNKGLTCKEVFDSIAFVYKTNLGISDATVKWNAVKQSDTLFVVNASLKGETGWADFSWQVKYPEEEITSIGDLNLCKSIGGTSSQQLLSTTSISQPQQVILNTQTNNKCYPPAIPGITFTSVKTYMDKLGLSCDVMVKDVLGYSSVCEDTINDGQTLIHVEVYAGNRPDDIYLILSSILQQSDNPSDDVSANFLGSIARIPYSNSTPDQAQLWVEKYISSYTPDSQVQDQPIEIFGGIRYHMSCASKSLRCLAIGQGSGSGWDYECNDTNIYTATPSVRILKSTNTPELTKTPKTITTVIPTNLPTSDLADIVETGTGNRVVSIEKWEEPALIHMQGNAGSVGYSLFSVQNDDGLFYASSFYPYDGVKLLDYFPDSNTTSLVIEAEDDWRIEIFKLMGDFYQKRLLNTPGIYHGKDDDVLFIGEGRYQINVEGNSARANFSIWSHGDFGDSYLMNQDLLVNVTDLYKGTIDLPEWVRILEIEAMGPWTIEIANR